MAAVTWKNVNAADTAGLFSNINDLNKGVTNGLSGVGDVLKARSTRIKEEDTQKYISELNKATTTSELSGIQANLPLGDYAEGIDMAQVNKALLNKGKDIYSIEQDALKTQQYNDAISREMAQTLYQNDRNLERDKNTQEFRRASIATQTNTARLQDQLLNQDIASNKLEIANEESRKNYVNNAQDFIAQNIRQYGEVAPTPNFNDIEQSIAYDNEVSGSDINFAEQRQIISDQLNNYNQSPDRVAEGLITLKGDTLTEAQFGRLSLEEQTALLAERQKNQRSVQDIYDAANGYSLANRPDSIPVKDATVSDLLESVGLKSSKYKDKIKKETANEMRAIGIQSTLFRSNVKEAVKAVEVAEDKFKDSLLTDKDLASKGNVQIAKLSGTNGDGANSWISGTKGGINPFGDTIETFSKEYKEEAKKYKAVLNRVLYNVINTDTSVISEDSWMGNGGLYDHKASKLMSEYLKSNGDKLLESRGDSEVRRGELRKAKEYLKSSKQKLEALNSKVSGL